MYFKVALLISALALAGCTNSTTLKPKPAEQPKPQESVLVVEEPQTTITPIKEEKIVEKDKYNFKPEPFSLKSNEDDPELLGPQTTLDREALHKQDDEDNQESKSSKAKKPSKGEKKEKKA